MLRRARLQEAAEPFDKCPIADNPNNFITMKKIVVVGSSNVDLIAKVSHLPRPGETVGNASFLQSYGGKGANQAVAAARLGGNVAFVTCLGGDSHGRELLQHFSGEGIRTDHVFFSSDRPTGTAMIFVSEQSAENCIAVAPGANGLLDSRMALRAGPLIADADIVLMQAEIPYDTVREVAFAAHRHGVAVMVNPAPACEIDPELMRAIDVLVVNETEAALIAGAEVNESTARSVAKKLVRMGARSVVITLGKAGAFSLSGSEAVFMPGFRVEAVDTTAAGDTFCGALAVACDRRITPEALRFACAASALSVMRLGAQSSMPQLEEVYNFLAMSNEGGSQNNMF